MDDVCRTKAELAGQIEDLRQMGEAFAAKNKTLRLLSSITEQVADSVIATDLDYKITYTNPSFQKMYGYSRDELLGQSPDILIASPNSDQIQKDIYETVSSGGVWQGEVENRRKDGTIFPCELTVFPLKDADGNVFAYAGTQRDITDRKQAEENLKQEAGMRGRLLDNLPCIAMILKKGTREIVASNEAAKQVGAIPGKTCYQMCAQRDDPCPFCRAPELWATDEPKRLEVKYRGTYYDGVWVPLTEDLYVHYILDITQRKQAEEALRKSEQRFWTLVESAPIAVYETDAQGKCLYVNEKWRELAGLTLAEALGGGWQKGLHKEDRARIFEQWNEHAQQQEPWDMEYRFSTPDGKISWVAGRATAMRDADGQVAGYIGANVDITERKKAEEQLEIAKHKAEAANIAKSQFLANMSHEIRTPMSVITGFANLLAAEELTDEQKSQAILIKKAGKSLLRIIDDVLDFSRIEAGKLEIRTREYHLKKMLDRVESMMQPLAARKRLDFEISCRDRLPAMIHTDDDRLVQCLVNLIGNAIKFTDKGNVYLKVSLEERRNKSFVRFDIQDTGIGIPHDKHESIFSSFTQVDGSHTRKQGGTGLGLTITKELAGLLGGDLSFTSEVDKGSVFSLIIPAGVDGESSILPGGDDRSEESASESQPVDNLTFRGRILVAEDEEGSQILTEKILKRFGLEVVIAENGKEAIEKALRESYDLILMDIQMPVLDGYEAVRKLRQEGITTPIIALTAYAMPGDREKCLEAGCDGYISKPFELKELRKVLSSHISIASSQI